MHRSIFAWPLLALAAIACGTTPERDTPDAGEQQIADAGDPPKDQCQNAEDLGWIKATQDGGLTGREVAREAAGDCGLGCLSDPAPDVCAIRCMKNIKKVQLTDNCAGCYGDIVLCTIEKCLPRCIDDPQAEDCKACQEEKGCQGAFDTCTGSLD